MLSAGAGLMSARTEFFTWREAVLQAIECAGRFSTASKPMVRWDKDRWVVEYDYRPVAYNGFVAA